MGLEDVLAKKDVALLNAFVGLIDERIGEAAGLDQLRAWEAQPALFQQIHAVVALDTEQSNGRFEQYFGRYAGYPPFVIAAIRGLEVVGNPAQVALAREAVAIFVHYFPALQRVMEEFDIRPGPRLTETDIDVRFREAGNLLDITIRWLEANRETVRALAG
jgi:hypothetical protein